MIAYNLFLIRSPAVIARHGTWLSISGSKGRRLQRSRYLWDGKLMNYDLYDKSLSLQKRNKE